MKEYLKRTDADLVCDLLLRTDWGRRPVGCTATGSPDHESVRLLRAWRFVYHHGTDTHGYRDLITADTPAWARP